MVLLRNNLLRLDAAFLIVSFGLHAFAAQIEVVENFVRPEQIQDLQKSKFVGNQRNPNGRFQADVVVPSFLIDRIRAVTSDEDDPTCNPIVDEMKLLKTSLIDATTTPHQDRYISPDDTSNRTPRLVIDEKVAFIFLNSNTNAAFVHGDTSIPVVAGNFVSFVGTTEHNTIVKDGYVHLLGPFTTKSFTSNVGLEVNPCAGCLAVCEQAYNACMSAPFVGDRICGPPRRICVNDCWNFLGLCRSKGPTYSPTFTPTTPTSPQPTTAPTTSAPSARPTTSAPSVTPTSSTPTSPEPTARPTTAAPSINPTSSAPTSSKPTAVPTTAEPSLNPTSSTPTSSEPSAVPTTSIPSINPTSSTPTFYPSASLTFQPTTLSPTTSMLPTTAPRTWWDRLLDWAGIFIDFFRPLG